MRNRSFSILYPSVSLSHGALLALIICAGILVKALAAFYLGDSVTELPGTADQVSYHALAVRVLEGHGFTFDKNWWPATKAGEPTAHWSYLYVLYLAGVYRVFGVHPLIARLIQVLLVGVAQVLLTYGIALRSFGKGAALTAAALNVLYLYFVYYAGTLMTEPFYITCILAVLYLAILISDQKPGSDQVSQKNRRKNLQYAVSLGVLIGFTVLLRQLFLIFVPFLFIWIWWVTRSKKNASGPGSILISVAITAALLLPFTVYNYARFQRFVLLNTNSGFAFFWGNHPIHGTDFITAREMEDYQSLIPAEFRTLDEAALDQALLKQGVQFVLDDPIRYLKLSASRIPVYFNFWPSSESGPISNITRVASFGLYLPFFLTGIWLWLRRQAPKGFWNILQSPGFLLLLFAGIYTGIHVLTWTLVRYRLPVDAVLMPFAALVVSRLFLPGTLDDRAAASPDV